MPDPEPRPDPRRDFESFYVRYRGFIAAVLKERYYRDDFDDVIQATMFNLWRQRDRYRPGRTQGWLPLLATIASRLVVSERRRCRTREVRLDPYVHDRTDDDPYVSPETRAIQAERTRLLDKLLADTTTLSPIERHAIALRRRGLGWRTATDDPALQNRLRWATHRAYQQLRRTAEAQNQGATDPEPRIATD